MALLPSIAELSPTSVAALAVVAILGPIIARIVYNLYLHPLAKFPGPWYAASFSIYSAIVSARQEEPEWLLSLVKKYGRDTPIRISPNMLLCPKPVSVADIYWDPKCNTKSGLYSTGVLGPTSLFTTISGDDHRVLRKALGGPQWSIGALKTGWEARIDDLLRLFLQRMREQANTPVILSDKLAEFAADVMTMISFNTPWGFVSNSRDERNILASWRQSLPFFGFAGRFRWFRETVLQSQLTAKLLPAPDGEQGIGFLMSQAVNQLGEREKQAEQGFEMEKPDFLQYTLEARIGNAPLDPVQKLAHVTLLIMAGADTTGTALGSTMRFLLANPSTLACARAEIDTAEGAGKLSSPVQYEETRNHLPYTVAAIKESLRLNPPATNLFGRVVPLSGKVLEGALGRADGSKGGSSVWVPAGAEITTNAYVVQRDPVLYAPDPEAYRPERWLESSKQRLAEMEASSFWFGVGPRVCLGKDIATMELYKVIPEVVRRLDMELLDEGRYVVAGGVAYNKGLRVRLTPRESGKV